MLHIQRGAIFIITGTAFKRFCMGSAINIWEPEPPEVQREITLFLGCWLPL